jgi:hypothetical protein
VLGDGTREQFALQTNQQDRPDAKRDMTFQTDAICAEIQEAALENVVWAQGVEQTPLNRDNGLISAAEPAVQAYHLLCAFWLRHCCLSSLCSCSESAVTPYHSSTADAG